jgi:multidrug resistance efflux pump
MGYVMALDIKWERPDQRLCLSVTAPLFVDIEQQRWKASEWSLEGFRIVGPGLSQHANDARQTLHITVPFQGFDVGFDAVCDVTVDPIDADVLVARFVDLGNRERELLSHFVEELLRGSMVSVRDTIQRIDVPVMPASLMPETAPMGLQSRLTATRRSLAMTTLYGLLGLGIFGYLALMLYASIFRMEVQSAMISAPIESVAAQAEGHALWGQFKPGDIVKSGDVVLRMFDNSLEREIEVAEVAIREREARLGYLRRRERNGVERLQSMPVVEMRQLTRSKLELDELRAQLSGLEMELRNPKPLSSRDSSGLGDPVKQRIAEVKSKIEAKEFELRTRKDTVNRNAVARRTPPGTQLVGSLDDLEAQIELARHEVQFAKERHNALVNQRERLVVRAPFDGRLVDLPHVDKGSIRKGDIVAILEQTEPRSVTAYLNDEEIVRIGLGDPARLYVPSVRETLKARVSRIDRSSAAGREIDPQTGLLSRWRNPGTRSAKVILAFEDASKVANAEKFRPGLPVVVVFEPRSSGRASVNEVRRIVEVTRPIYETVRQRLTAVVTAWSLAERRRRLAADGQGVERATLSR